MRDALIPFCIRYVAGFLYWWMIETNQLVYNNISKMPVYLRLDNKTINGDFYVFRTSSISNNYIPDSYNGTIWISPDNSKNVIIDKCARNVNLISTKNIVISPGFKAKKGCFSHLFILDESEDIKCLNLEKYPSIYYNRKTETDCDCKSNYE